MANTSRATALGVAAVKAGRQVYRASLAELIDALAKAERQGQFAEKIRFYTRASLLIVDEIRYLPISRGGANLFFQFVNARYEKGAMILTLNRGFAEWGDIFGDPNASKDGQNALSASIKDTNLDSHLRIQALLKAGASLPPDDASRLLHKAVLWSGIETIQVLIHSGGDPFYRLNGQSLLHRAVQSYHTDSPEVIGFLIDLGLAPDAGGPGTQDGETGQTPLERHGKPTQRQ